MEASRVGRDGRKRKPACLKVVVMMYSAYTLDMQDDCDQCRLDDGGLRTVVDVLQPKLTTFHGNRCQQQPLRSQMAISRNCDVMLFDRVVIRNSTCRDKYTTMMTSDLIAFKILAPTGQA